RGGSGTGARSPIVSRTRPRRVEAGISSREPERDPPRRPRRLLDRAQPALLPRAARAARLPPGQRGRRRAWRDDLLPPRPELGRRPAPAAGAADPRARPLRARPAPPLLHGAFARNRRRAGQLASRARRGDRERAGGIRLRAGVLRGVLLRPRRTEARDRPRPRPSGLTKGARHVD